MHGRPADRLCGEKAQKATAARAGQNRIRNYEFLKEYDDYDVITPEDVHLRLFGHEELTKAGLGYLRWIYR